ncbi:MAG: YigZ family protein [Bacteroidales bacterium]|nr:YigZ family protein [Bacteroidales bacterium]
MLFSDEYYTIESRCTGQFRDRGSRFISVAIPVETESQVKIELEALRKQYYDATHHCYSYVLGADKSAWRINDDGEPSGTAGRPIYGQILSADLTNILIVVIRYYGGTKLGVSGLINAYKTAALEAINSAERRKCIVKEVYLLEFEYEAMDKVMKVLKEGNADFQKSEFGMKCVIEFAIPRLESAKLLERFERVNSLTIKYLMTI